MKARFFVVVALVCLVAAVARLDSQMSASHSAVEMTGVKATMKLQTPVEGFFAPLNGKLDLRATEVEVEPGGSIKDHYHFGPGIRRMLSGELTLVYADTKKEQVVGAGEYFYEPGDVNINGVNRGKEPAKLVIVELVPAGLKGSAMVPLDRRAELAANGSRLKEEICSAK
jgi:quercetin dioxygenase-like cupin family protein